MKHFHQELKTYAASGLRTASDWSSLGREVKPDSACRATVEHRGEVLPLFDRDQTRVRSAAIASPMPVAADGSPA